VAPEAPHDGVDSDAYASQVPVVPPLQQPPEHVLASHEQTPTVASHRPFAQAPHDAPPLPHCNEVCEAYGTHWLPLQQPLEHDVASQTHWPVVLSHSWPVAHDPHATPAAPHEVFDSDAYASHVVPLQQPIGHEVGSQTHCPPEHSWPAAHTPHVAPPLPHSVFDSLMMPWQAPPEVQQPVQVPPPHVHAPLVQASPAPHALHCAPAVPHWPDDCAAYRTHVPPLQQPVGHEVASQTHCPVALLHSWPVAHDPQVAPSVPHEPVDSEA
jgi:hypothetical protein